MPEIGLWPLIKRGKGPFLYDYDENRYVDFSLGGGALNLGHSHPRVTAVVKSWLGRGYGADPLTSCVTATHQRLSKRLWAAVWGGKEKPEVGGWVFVYGISPCEALCDSLHLAFGGEAPVPPDRESERFPPSRVSRILRTAGPLRSGSGKRGAVVLGPPFEDPRYAEPALEGREAETGFFISDETELLFHSMMRNRPELMRRLGGRIIGSWAAAGLPFGCVMLDASRLDVPKTAERAVPSAGSLPLYLVKAAANAIDTRERLGGIDGLLAKQRALFEALGTDYFAFREGMVFMRERERLRVRYAELREQLMRGGMLFPISPHEPLSVSLAHDTELLSKCGRQINSIFERFFR